MNATQEGPSYLDMVIEQRDEAQEELADAQLSLAQACARVRELEGERDASDAAAYRRGWDDGATEMRCVIARHGEYGMLEVWSACAPGGPGAVRGIKGIPLPVPPGATAKATP